MVLSSGIGSVFKNAFGKVGNFFKNLPDSIRGVGNSFKGIGSWLNDKWEDFTGITANNANLEFQRENLDYQKAIQQQIFEREDSAYTRSVADMRRAGLNPVSMNGTNGAGEAVATNAPQTQRTSDLQALGDIMNVVSQLNVNRNNNTLSQANANLVNAQADNQKIKNLYEADILGKTIEGLNFSNIGQRFKNERENIAWQQDVKNLAFNDQFHISNNMPDFAKYIAYATNQGNLPKDWYRKQVPENWYEFGRHFSTNQDFDNPSFTNLESVLEKTNLKGALSESALGNMFLKMLGIQ